MIFLLEDVQLRAFQGGIIDLASNSLSVINLSSNAELMLINHEIRLGDATLHAADRLDASAILFFHLVLFYEVLFVEFEHFQFLWIRVNHGIIELQIGVILQLFLNYILFNLLLEFWYFSISRIFTLAALPQT